MDHLLVEDFGQQLLSTGDLDPVYVALYKMDQDWMWDPGQDKRWLIAYWMFYNCGVASYLSELRGLEYWEAAMTAAENIEDAPPGGRWPRGKERRHFRGEAATTAVRALTIKYGATPEAMVDYCWAPTLREVTQRVQSHAQFGPWIGFKVADMLERILGLPVAFNDAEVMMFKDPTKAALMVWNAWDVQGKLPQPRTMTDKERVTYVAQRLTNYFRDHWTFAPPRHNRSVNIQEVETILCKWKSHCNGHYPVGNDIHEIAVGTAPWAKVSPTAEAFLSRLPNLAAFVGASELG